MAARLLAPLQALTDDTPEDRLEQHLRAIWVHAPPAEVGHVLLTTARTRTASKTGLRALILHVTDPRNTDQPAARASPAATFPEISADDDMALLFARRSAARLLDDPAVWWDNPAPDTPRRAAARAGPETAALIALTDPTLALTPPDPVADHAGT